jgi:cytochrome d ubiquinol oxidase subunit I
MIVLSWYGAYVTRRQVLAPRWLLWAFAGFTFTGWIATLSGWIVTEMGRQPWMVSGLVRTADVVGDISGAQLGSSLTAYALTYAAMLAAYMVVLTHMAGKGADGSDPPAEASAALVPRAARAAE